MGERLLLFVTDLKRGGTPLVVKGLALGLRGRGHEVEVACLDRMGEVGEELLAEGVRVHALGARGVWDVGVAGRFRRLVAEEQYTRVVSFLVHANAVAAWASRGIEPASPGIEREQRGIVSAGREPDGAGGGLVGGPTGGQLARGQAEGRRGVRWFQAVQTTQPRPGWHWRVQGWAAKAAEKVIVPSDAVARACADRSGIPREKLTVVPNAVDAGRLAGLGGAGGKRVVFLGRLDPIKRIGDLITAAEVLGPAYEVRIFGEGEDRRRLEQLAAAARAKGANVELCGGVPWAGEALKGADVLVLPSEAEGFGLVLIEAMAAGVTVVASRAPGITDVVRDGETGLLFDVGDAAGLAAAVRRVCDDRGLREALRERGAVFVADQFSPGRVLRGWEAALGLDTD